MTDRDAAIARLTEASKWTDGRGELLDSVFVIRTDLEAALASPSPAQWPEDVVERLTKAANRFRTVGAPQGDLWSGARNDLVKEAVAFVDTLATLPPPEDATRDQIVAAWIDGATAVHNAWIDGNGEREADFTEAAHDYAASLPTPPEDERVKGLVRALETIDYIVNADTDWPADDVTDVIRHALASYRGGA